MKLNIPTRFETDRLVLQQLKYEDAEEMFYSYASKTEATKFVPWPTHESMQHTNEYLKYCERAWKSGHNYNFSIRLKLNNQLIGSIGAVNDLGNINFGYIVSPSHWNHGYATEAGISLVEVLRKQKEVYKIWTFVDAENLASCRVLQKIGLEEEARMRNWKRFANQGNRPKDCIFFDYPLERK